MDGLIFDIQRFSTHDGPGIRTTVFFKGCGMRCLWCHNPESIRPKQEIQVFRAKCIGCGRCLQVCPTGAHRFDGPQQAFMREKCSQCGKCADACPAEALVLTGRRITVSEALEEIERDRPFYETSQGGVTVSGGEPLLQVEFLREILSLCRAAGFHTAVETAGNVPWEALAAILPVTDLFLYDLKLMDAELHRRWTGVDNARILENLQKLTKQGAFVHIRVPVIPSVNDTLANMQALADFVRGLRRVEKVELIPFHRMAAGKYESLGLEYETRDFEQPGAEELKKWVDFLAGQGIPANSAI